MADTEEKVYKKMSVEQFLVNHAHKKVEKEYVKKQKQDVLQATKLQNFLRQLQEAARTEKTNVTGRSVYDLDYAISQETLAEILDTVDENLKKDGLSTGIDSLFQRTAGKAYWRRGDYFERELQAVWLAVFQRALGGNADLGDWTIRTGQVTGTTSISKEMRKKLFELINKGVSTDEAIKMLKISKHDNYQQRVQIKTDINGLPIIDVDTIENPEIRELYQLLQGATVTAKSYALYTYDNAEESKKKLKEVFPYLKIGESENIYRAIVGTLQDVGYSLGVAEKVFNAGQIEVGKNNQTVLNHMHHLIYVYELTGAGTWNELNVGRAKFLIFNDPSSDLIYVQSAAAIIREALDEKTNWRGPLGGQTRLGTEKFYYSTFD